MLDSKVSYWLHIKSGVPQGSVIRPMMVFNYVNDRPDFVHSVLRLFADDVRLFQSIFSVSDLFKVSFIIVTKLSM